MSIDFLAAAGDSAVRNAARWKARFGALEQGGPFPMPPFLPTEDRCGIIAEVKLRSPSRGVLLQGRDPAALAALYAANGAEAVSVVVEEEHFGGSPELFREVRRAVSLPMLWKDFVVDSYQVALARSMGASAILLLAALLSGDGLSAMVEVARREGLRPLVEVHSEEEADRALAAGADLVGVNHRNLKTLEVDLVLSKALAPRLVRVQAVAESGLKDGRDVAAMRRLGYRAVLVGEALVTSRDTGALLKSMAEAGAAR